LEKEMIEGTLPGKWPRGRPRRAWLDIIITWTVLSLGEALRASEDRTVWWKIVRDVANSLTLKEG